MVKHCHCANNSKVTNECLILTRGFLGRVGCMGDSSSKEASIKLNQHILRINEQNLVKHEVFLHYSHTSVDDTAFCSKKPGLLQYEWQRWCTHDLSTPMYSSPLWFPRCDFHISVYKRMVCVNRYYKHVNVVVKAVILFLWVYYESNWFFSHPSEEKIYIHIWVNILAQFSCTLPLLCYLFQWKINYEILVCILKKKDYKHLTQKLYLQWYCVVTGDFDFEVFQLFHTARYFCQMCIPTVAVILNFFVTCWWERVYL